MAQILEPLEIDALLRPDLRTVAADLYALSDDLDRMCTALRKLATTMAELRDATSRLTGQGSRGSVG